MPQQEIIATFIGPRGAIEDIATLAQLDAPKKRGSNKKEGE
jgi:hypothetical protein